MSTKLLLPLFGGGAFVWTLSMMFFQGLLLAGYLYAGKVLKLSYGKAHALLLLIPLFFFPLAAPPGPAGGSPPLNLLWALLRLAAAPFFALSTTSLVVQDWLVRSDLPARDDPYFIYGASNAGALLGLLSYPFVIEPSLTLKSQSWLWCFLYVVCAALVLSCLPVRPAAPAGEGRRTSWRDQAHWAALSAASSSAMLACSNSLSYNIASAPLLWVLPLALYLASFYLTFKRRPWLASGMAPLLAVSIVLMAFPALLFATVGWRLSPRDLSWVREFSVLSRIGLDIALLFSFCMLCHRGLAQSRPEPELAPRFYVAIALGGWLGSVLISVLLPLLARRVATLNLDWGLAGALAAGAALLRREEDIRAAWRSLGSWWKAASLSLTAILLGAAAMLYPRGSVFVLRNFYGIYTVKDFGELRKFYHGNTIHGMQYMDRYLRPYPMSYYHPHSPLGQVYDALGGSFKTIGAVGLGVGSVAAYGKPGQTLDFYELDADVVRIAETRFTYLKDSQARVNVIVGDARLSLEKKKVSYDLLVLDAFTSDAIPLHLMTKEAFEIYLAKLAPGGVIACHISNRMLDLKPVLAGLASSLGLYGAFQKSDPAGLRVDEEIPSHWVVLSREAAPVALLKNGRGWVDILKFERKDKRVWTDQYASVLGALAL